MSRTDTGHSRHSILFLPPLAQSWPGVQILLEGTRMPWGQRFCPCSPRSCSLGLPGRLTVPGQGTPEPSPLPREHHVEGWGWSCGCNPETGMLPVFTAGKREGAGAMAPLSPQFLPAKERTSQGRAQTIGLHSAKLVITIQSRGTLNVAWGTFFPSVSSMSRTTDQTNGVIITDFFFENKHTSFPSCCTPSGVKGCMPLLLPEKQGFQGHMSYISTFCVNENKTWGTRYTAINTLIRNLLRTITAQNYWQNIFSKRNYCGSVGGTS